LSLKIRGLVLLDRYFIIIAGDKIDKNEIGEACSWMGRRETCIGIMWGNLREKDHWEDPGVDGRIILRRIFRKWDVGVWTGLGWLRIETGCRQL
jgi:hypothetical protein